MGGEGGEKAKKKIYARENAKKKNSCKEDGKEKKFMQKEGPIVISIYSQPRSRVNSILNM